MIDIIKRTIYFEVIWFFSKMLSGCPLVYWIGLKKKLTLTLLYLLFRLKQ